MLHAHEQVGAYLHRCKQSVPATAQRKRRNNGPPSLPRTHTNSDTHAGIDAYTLFSFSLFLSYTHIHTVYSIKIKWTVWKHKAQQASLVSYFRWWFKADHTTTGREAAEQEAKTEARPQSAAAAFCQPATLLLFFCLSICLRLFFFVPTTSGRWMSHAL